MPSCISDRPIVIVYCFDVWKHALEKSICLESSACPIADWLARARGARHAACLEAHAADLRAGA